MLKSKIQYILTWAALVVLLIGGILLVALSWNGIQPGMPSPVMLIMIWIAISASGIFLFMLAVKKAHRLLVDEERNLKEPESNIAEKSPRQKDASKEKQVLDFTASARKLVRRIPEDASLEEAGKGLLKNLARELEIMAGVFYVRKKSQFVAVSNYAKASPEEPYSFKEGEGLTGQVARNQRVMILTRLPEEHLEVYSGLGKAPPAYLAIVPLILKNKTVAVLECSGYRYDPHDIENMFRIFARELMEKLSQNL
jgi:hypothetical protein